MKIIRIFKNYFKNQKLRNTRYIYKKIKILSEIQNEMSEKIDRNNSLLKKINKKINLVITRSIIKKESALDLYLVKYDKRDGKFMSDYQRWIEGKPSSFFQDND